MQSPETDDNVLSFIYEEITSDNSWYNNTDVISLLWLLLILIMSVKEFYDHMNA